MYRLRLFANRHSRSFEWVYLRVESLMVALDPLFSRIGYRRVEYVVAPIERLVKSILFDCRMCGQCVLSSTGMSCPMNCPKTMRNGPCGGVRPGGFCEVKPHMKCVWVLAWDGATRMRNGERIGLVLPPVDHALQGSSAWLRASRAKAAQRREAGEAQCATRAGASARAREKESTTTPLAPEPEPRKDRETDQ